MGSFGSTTNLALLGLMVVLSVFQFFSLKKEFPLNGKSLIMPLLPIPLTILAYWVIFGKTPVSPMFLYLLMAGLIIGLLLGAFTRVYPKGDHLFGRRSRFYLILWLLILLFTQGTVKLAGTAMASIGTSFMFFSLGMALAQQSILGVKAGPAKRKALAGAGALLLLFFLLSPLPTGAEPNPFQDEKDGAHAYYLMAKDAFAQGDMSAAIGYGQMVVSSTRSPGTQAKGYMVIYLAGGGDHYGTLAHQGIMNSGQMEGVEGEGREGYALLIGLGIMEDIESWQYKGYAIPPNENIIQVEGVFTIASSQIPGFWEDFKKNLGITEGSALGGIVGAFDALVRELADSEPVGDGQAAASAAAASGILLISGLLNLLTQKPAAETSLAQGTAEIASETVPPKESSLKLPEDSPYVEGQTYSFHDGRVYKVEKGHLVPIRSLKEGEVFVDPEGDRRIWAGNQAWMESDWKQQQSINQEYREAHQADWEKASTTLTPEMVDFFNRQNDALSEAQRLAHLAERIKSGRVKVGDNPDKVLDDLNKFINATRSSGKIDPDQYASLRETVGKGLRQGQEVNIGDMLQAHHVAWRWEVATKSVEYVKSGADLAIDGLAKVTGPKGKAIQRLYKAASTIGGGVSEGYVTGNWVEAMVETGAQLVDNEIGDRLKTKSGKALYKVVQKGTKSGYKSGKAAFKEGDDVLGAAALGFLEGAADGASGVVKDSLEGGQKFIYTLGEGAVKGGYDALKKGGDAADAFWGAGSGAFSGGLESAAEAAFDHFIPEIGAVSDSVVAEHQWHILKERNLGENPVDLLNQVLPLDEWRTELLTDELRKVFKDGFVNMTKGEGLPADVYQLGSDYFNLGAMQDTWTK